MNHGGLSGEVENAYLATLRVTLGGVATHMPNAALLEITGSSSPAWRRRASRAIFKRALEAVAVGERAVVLDVLRSARSDAFTARSITDVEYFSPSAGRRLRFRRVCMKTGLELI